MRYLSVLADFLRENKRRYCVGIVFLLAVDGLQLAMPKILGRVADRLQAGALADGDLLLYASIILALAAAMALGRYIWRMKVMGAARTLDCGLRFKLFTKLQTLSANYFNHHKTGDLMAHATNDVQAVRMAAGPGVAMSVDSLFLAGMTVFIAARTIDWRLTLVTLLPLPLLVLIVVLCGREIHRRFLAVQEAFSRMTEKAQESFSGIRVVKSFVQEEAETAAFAARSRDVVALNIRLTRISGLFHPLIGLVGGVCFVIALAFGGTLVVNARITLGDFVAFLNYLGLLIWPITAIGWVINIVQRGMASLDRLGVILQEIPEITNHPSAVVPASRRGEIAVRGLTFTYPGAAAPALRGLDLTVPPGRTLAVVGRTGSGKSTLAHLLMRLYDPPAGTVFLDGADITRIPLQMLRESIGFVPQENFLFSTTVHENIGFAGERFTEDEVAAAARTARVYEDIAGFPAGFATVVGERGVTLSGGQKQRISIARALIKNPLVLILDDCLSAVDTRTEEAIRRNLRSYMDGRTSIVISHRLSTIQDADEILVLDGGRVAERGNHASLLAKGGIYADLYQKQLLEEELAATE